MSRNTTSCTVEGCTICPTAFLADELIVCGAILSMFELCQALRELGHECNIVSKHNNEELENYFGIRPRRKRTGITISFTPKLTGKYGYVRTRDERWKAHTEPKIAVSAYIGRWIKAEQVIGNGTHSRFKNLNQPRDIDILLEGNDEKNKNIPETVEKAIQIAKERNIESPRICWFGRNTTPIEGIECISHPKIEDIPKLYNRAKIFLKMSHNEGFGRPVAEATKCGCEVINLSGGNKDIEVVSWESIAKQLINYLDGGQN